MTRNTNHKPSSINIHFPQPTRPLNVNDTINSSAPSMNMINDTKFSDNHEYYVTPANNYMDTIVEEEEHEEEDQYRFEDIDQRLRRSMLDIYQKLPKKVQHKLNLEGSINELIRERDSQQQILDDITYSSRGLQGSQTEELGQRLERFKIRTLDPNGGAIVKDETK